MQKINFFEHTRHKKIRWPLIFMFLVFVTPIAIAALMLPYLKNINIAGNAAHGLLIANPYILNINVRNDIYSDNMVNAKDTSNKWQLVYIRPTHCEQACQQQLQQLRQLHIALGAEKNRVSIYTSLTNDINLQVKEGGLIILNPFSYYIMHYTADCNYSLVLKDLRRLLKYSHAN